MASVRRRRHPLRADLPRITRRAADHGSFSRQELSMTLLHIARHSRTRSLSRLSVIVCLLLPIVGHANRQEPSARPTLSLNCEPSILAAPWTGVDTLTCQVANTDPVQTDAVLACEDAP